MKKYLAVFLTLLLVFSAVAGCSQPANTDADTVESQQAETAAEPETATEPEVAAAEPVTIEFWWAPTFADEEANRKWIDETLADFYAANPNVTVNYTLIPWSEYASKLALTLSSGEDCPDIFYTYPEQVWEFADAGWLHPIDEYFTNDDKADFLGVADGSWKEQFYMAPILYSVYGYVYNGQILDEIGWDRTKLPTSLEELDAMFAAAHEKGYIGGGLSLYFYDHLSPILHYSWGTGKCYVSRDGVVTTADNEALKKVFEYQVKWINNGYLRDECWITNGTDNPDITDFLGGQQVMSFVPAMTLKSDAFQTSEVDWIVGPYPKAYPDANNTGVGIACGFAMTEACANKEIAGQIIQALTNAQSQVSFNEVVGYMCARKSCGNIFASLRGFDALAEVYANLDDSYGATWNYITSSLSNSILAERQAMYMGTQTVDETLVRIAALLQEGLDSK